MAEENTAADTDGQHEAKNVPLAALEDERRKRQTLETEVAELRGTVRGLAAATQKPASDPKPTLSAAELRQSVEDGRMTEEEAAAINERQIEKRVERRITDRVERKLANQQVETRVGAVIAEYKAAIPNLSDTDSAQFAKVKGEFDQLVGLGYDANDLRTEAAALRAAFGDPTKIRKIAADPPRTHVETGGASAPDGQPADAGWPKDMTPRLKTHYQRLIDRGIYKGRDDPKIAKEAARINSGIASRAQARAA